MTSFLCVCVSPVGVEAGDGGFSMAVQVLSLLQQNVVEHSSYVDLHVVLDGLQHSHVGPHTGQQLRRLGDLLRGLVIHRHPHDGPEGLRSTHSLIKKQRISHAQVESWAVIKQDRGLNVHTYYDASLKRQRNWTSATKTIQKMNYVP